MVEQLDLFESLRGETEAAVSTDVEAETEEDISSRIEAEYYAPFYEGDGERDPYAMMCVSCLRADIPMIGMDKCCQLAAWVYVFGGGNEMTVYNSKLRNSVLYAQRRLNLMGGERPNADWLPVLRDYIRELEAYSKNSSGGVNNGVAPEWLVEFEKRYNVESRA